MRPLVTTLVFALLILAPGRVLADDTQANWDAKCVTCHGKDGAGATRKGKQLKALDYTSAAVQAKFTDLQLRDAISKGIESKKMPAYSGELTPAQIEALVKLIRSFKK